MRAFVTGVVGASGPLIASRLLSAAVTMALPLMLARLLEPNAFGVYKQFFMVSTSVLMLGQIGLTQSLYYFLPRGGAARGSYLAQAAALLWPLGALLAIALFVLAPPLAARFGIGGLVALRAPLAVTVACMVMAAPLEPALTADGRTRGAALTYLVTEALRALALIAGAHLGMRWHWTAALFWGAAAVAVLRVAALVALAAWRVLPLAPPRRDRLRAQLAFALPFAGASLLYVGQRFSPQYLVSARFDAATFALFTIASFHLGVVELVFAPVTEVLMVQLGRTLGRDAPASVAAFDESVKTLASLLFPATCGAWLFGPTVLPMLFTHRYEAAVPLFMLTTVEIPLCVLPVDALLRAAGDTRFLLGFNVARLVGTIALVAAGIELDGLAGAILGAIAGESLARLALLSRGRRYLGVRSAAQLLDGPWLARVALASALACVPAWLTQRCFGPGVASVVTAGVVYGMSYAVLRQRLIRRAPVTASSPPVQPQPADCA